MVSPEDARREQRRPSTGTISLGHWCAPSRKFSAWLTIELLVSSWSCIMYFGRFWVDPFNEPAIQPISMRSNNSRKIIPCHLTTDFQGTYDISIEKSISFTLWLTMAVLHQKMRWELRKKFQFVCPCQKLRKFRTGRISVESIGRTCRYPQDIARCKQVCTRFEQKIVNFFLWQRNLRVAFARCFRWASGGIWKTWARTGPLL